MAKKFGKFLLFTAAIGAAGAAAYYYMQKKDFDLLNGADEDYDDFSEDTEDGGSRTYVPLSHDDAPAQESDSQEEGAFTPLTEKVSAAVDTAKDELKETVENFFDEDASAETESSEEFFDDEDTEGK